MSEPRANAREVQKLRKMRNQSIAKLEHKQKTLRHHCLRTIGFRCGWTQLSDFLPAPEGAGLPDSSNTFGFIHRLEFDTVRAYCVVA